MPSEYEIGEHCDLLLPDNVLYVALIIQYNEVVPPNQLAFEAGMMIRYTFLSGVPLDRFA